MSKKPVDGSDNGRYTERHKKTVLEELGKDGVILELGAYQKFSAQGWDTELNPRFSKSLNRDLSWKERIKEFEKHISRQVDEDIGEIDLISEHRCSPECDPFTFSDISLVVECKTRLDMNWVLLMKENPLFTERDISLKNYSISESSVFNYLNREYPEDFPFWGKEIHEKFGALSHHSGVNLPLIAQTGWGLFKNRNSLYDAVRHVLDAYDYQILEHCFHTELDLHQMRKGEKDLRHWRSYPVIIFDGALWGLTLNKGEYDIEPIDYAALRFTHHNRTYLVDIVQWNQIDNYIDKLKQEIEGLNQLQC